MTDNDRLQVAIISAGPPGEGPAAAYTEWIRGLAERRRDVDVEEVVATGLPECRADEEGAERPETVQRLAIRLAVADAYVVVTPSATEGCPPAVQRVLDWLADEWWAKPVAFVAYGKPAGGVHALGHLLPAFTAVGAVCLRETVNLPDVPPPASRSGECEGPECAARAMFDELVRWGHALREARSRRLVRG